MQVSTPHDYNYSNTSQKESDIANILKPETTPPLVDQERKANQVKCGTSNKSPEIAKHNTHDP